MPLPLVIFVIRRPSFVLYFFHLYTVVAFTFECTPISGPISSPLFCPLSAKTLNGILVPIIATDAVKASVLLSLFLFLLIILSRIDYLSILPPFFFLILKIKNFKKFTYCPFLLPSFNKFLLHKEYTLIFDFFEIF